MTETRIHEKGAFSLSNLIKHMKEGPDFWKAGAVALFVGVVRGGGLDEEKVEKLELEAYEEKANEVLGNICQDLKSREGIVDVRIHHLLGEFGVSEELVYVLVAASHRRYAFPVLEEAVERYKKEAPIFKKEYVTTREGETKAYWISNLETEK
ncbi:hypothetical protein GTO27_07985 [Candidatus Bathyarchaeota archaeon]|nr:hypothetical protein [Candidatus Bathyarchaeota archaeon]